MYREDFDIIKLELKVSGLFFYVTKAFFPPLPQL